MDVLKAFVRDGEVADWRDGVTCHLSALTMKALSSPFGYIRVHRGPDDFGADRLACALHAGVTESMYCVKNRSAEGQWDEWSSRTVANVDYEVRVAYVDVLKV